MNRTIKNTLIAAPLLAFSAFSGIAGANAASTSTWDSLAQCESGGNWSTNTGNGYAGGLQFSPSTWSAFGGSGSASNASKGEQIQVAERVLAEQGWGAWPSCSASTGIAASGEASTPTQSVTEYTETKAPAAVNIQPQELQEAPVEETAPALAPVETVVPEPTAPVENEISAPVAPVEETAPVVIVDPVEIPAEFTAPVQTTSSETHTVVAGDTLYKIADQHNTTVENLVELNPQITNINLIFIGDIVNLPVAN